LGAERLNLAAGDAGQPQPGDASQAAGD